MIQLSTETKTDIALQLEGYVEGAVAPAINLIFTNQYTKEVTTYRTVYPIVTGRASQMEIDDGSTVPRALGKTSPDVLRPLT